MRIFAQQVMKNYNRLNFHKHTFCVFREMPLSEIQNRTPDFTSKSGSVYYFTPTGVYRLSDHWSRVANCRWRIDGNSQNRSRTKLGFALWSNFHHDNDTEKLYFIRVNFKDQTAHYEHKDNAPNEDAVLRTASETAKIVKQIRVLLLTDSWARHLVGDIDGLRKTIIDKLITSNLDLAQIKRSL